MKIALFSFLSLFSFYAFSYCGGGEFELKHAGHVWSEVASYSVSSAYQNIDGSLCVGAKNNKLEYLIYRDNIGTFRASSKKELQKKDIIFFNHQDFPSAARIVTRSTPSLTARIYSLSEGSASTYEAGVTFLRNVGKGLSKDDIRVIKIKLVIKNNIAKVYTDNTEFNSLRLNLGYALKISELIFYKDTKLLFRKPAKSFEQGIRIF